VVFHILIIYARRIEMNKEGRHHSIGFFLADFIVTVANVLLEVISSIL